MKRLLFTGILLCTLTCFSLLWATPEARINEFHYDNSGADKGEFVEILLLDDETINLSSLICHLYNGSDGQIYSQLSVSDMKPGQSNGTHTVYSWSLSGIQNGSPDGIALSYSGEVLEAISYEGNVSGIDPPCNGVSFTDIDISESSATLEGESLYLRGAAPFTWTSGTATKGEFNTGQILADASTPIELNSFTFRIRNHIPIFTWITESEINNAAFIIERDHCEMTKIPSQGNGSSTRSYTWSDKQTKIGNSYTYTLYSLGLDNSRRKEKTLLVRIPLSNQYCSMLQAAPNPFNSQTCLKFNVEKTCHGSIIVYNSLGKMIKEISDKTYDEGAYEINLDLKGLPSGTYFVRYNFGKNYLSQRIQHIK